MSGLSHSVAEVVDMLETEGDRLMPRTNRDKTELRVLLLAGGLYYDVVHSLNVLPDIVILVAGQEVSGLGGGMSVVEVST